MAYEDLEKLKKDHDYCIIPIQNIIGIEDNMPLQGCNVRTINIMANSGEFCQFVNSDYFRTWGKGIYFEENNKITTETDLLYRPSNITVEELRDGAMKEIEAIIERFNASLNEKDKVVNALLGEVKEVEDD